ncbi:MAG: alpha-hydroxy acid oxidase, partial [Lautropia sp.]
VCITPTGIAGLLWHEGEIALAKAAAKAGIPFSLATTSVTPMEEVAEKAGGRLWYQLYMWPERRMSYEMVLRAEKAGFEALILTLDTVVTPNREYNRRNGYTSPFKFTPRNVSDVCMHPRWLFRTLMPYLMSGGMPQFQNYPAELVRKITEGAVDKKDLKNESLTWDDLKALRDMWPRILIAKGILRPDDADRAVECGADAILVSNHGGRNLDSTMAPIDALPEIVAAIRGRVPVLVDSGFRRGSDVVKALALGASAVALGRGTLYGTAAAGQPGAERALAIFKEEISRVMAFVGSPRIADLNRDLLRVKRDSFMADSLARADAMRALGPIAAPPAREATARSDAEPDYEAAS